MDVRDPDRWVTQMGALVESPLGKTLCAEYSLEYLPTKTGWNFCFWPNLANLPYTEHLGNFLEPLPTTKRSLEFVAGLQVRLTPAVRLDFLKTIPAVKI